MTAQHHLGPAAFATTLPLHAAVTAQHPDITFAKFDTTLEPLEGLAAELGVKALPAFHFFKARGRRWAASHQSHLSCPASSVLTCPA